MKVRFLLKLFFFAIALSSIVAAGLYFFYRNDRPIHKIDIISAGKLNYISQSQIIALFKPLDSQNWLSVNVQKIKDELVMYPGIKALVVQKKWPDILWVEISEYQPMAYWDSPEHLLLENGQVITPRFFSTNKVWPILHGDPQDSLQMLDNFNAFQVLARRHNRRITDLYYRGNQWRIQLKNGVSVLLGKEHLKGKLNKLFQNYSKIIVPESKKIGVIDMRYHSGFAIKFIKAA